MFARNRVSNREVGERFFSSLMVHTASGVHQVSYSMATAVKRMSHKVYSPTFIAKVRNEWSCVSIAPTPSWRFMKDFTFRKSSSMYHQYCCKQQIYETHAEVSLHK